MSFKITLQINKSPKNKIGKSLTTIKELEGTLKNESSILDPKILIKIGSSEEMWIADNDNNSGNSISKCNYFTIPNFNRKYFVTDIKLIRNTMIEISGHVDVLDTYSSDILNHKYIMARSQSKYNQYLPDNQMATYADSYTVNYSFPQKFSHSNENLILAVAGAGQ